MPCKGGQLLQSILTLVTNHIAHNDPISSSALQIHVGKKKKIINETIQTKKLKKFNQNRTTLDSTREAELLSSANTGYILDFYQRCTILHLHS